MDRESLIFLKAPVYAIEPDRYICQLKLIADKSVLAFITADNPDEIKVMESQRWLLKIFDHQCHVDKLDLIFICETERHCALINEH